MFKRLLPAAALIAAVAAPMAAEAHRPWLMPSGTVLSGDEAWIGVDGGMSETVFVADHAAMRLDGIKITAPDGSTLAQEHPMQGQYRSTFDVHLTQRGTYRIGSAFSGVMATWMLNGTPGRWRGAAADLAANVPAGATDLASVPSANRIETFVTLGEPTDDIFTPTGQGIEMVPVSHPNDLVADEPATFQFLKDGQPLADADITVARGGGQYRDNPEEMTLKTGADGKVTVTWPQPGLYWINTSWRPPGAPPRVEGMSGPPVASAAYTATLEVLP